MSQFPPVESNWERDAVAEAAVAAWSVFDPDWYRKAYPAVAETLTANGSDSEYDYYITVGAALGHSPNRWFDELWYLDTYPDVLRAVRRGEWSSGFAQYCGEGYATLSPHWLFSEALYRSRYPELTRQVLREVGAVNGYDHYLRGGEKGFRSGSLFFDPYVFSSLSPRMRREKMGGGPDPMVGPTQFSRFLALDPAQADLSRASWYFDPVWYLRRYPEVAEDIAAGTFFSALHHYLLKGAGAGFDPQESFSEAFYAEAYPDVGASVKAGQFRSGFDHFLSAGALEGRLPIAACDLAQYAAQANVRADIENGLFRDPYAHWVASRAQRAFAPTDTRTEEGHTKARFIGNARAAATLLGRTPPDFTCVGTPVVSVVVILHDQFALTMATLGSLRDNLRGDIELILVDSGSTDETTRIEHYVRGAKIIHMNYNAGFVRGCNLALEQATAAATLYLNNDLRLAPGALANALARLSSARDIGAVGAKIVRTNGVLQEAGSIVWRDGSTCGYLRDGDPNSPAANFVRDVDYCSGAFLLAPTTLLKELGGFDIRYSPAYFEDVDLCVRIIGRNLRVVYDPSVMIEHLEYGSSTSTASLALMQRNRRIFAALQSEFLRHQLPAHPRNVPMARSRRRPGARILFIEDRIPLRDLGSGYVRSNDIIRSLARLGHQVTVFPVNSHYHSIGRLYGDLPDTVEILFDRSASGLDAFLEEYAGCFDIVWIGRTHNLNRVLPILHGNHRYLVGAGFVLDTEVVAAPRTALRERVLGLPATIDDLDTALRAEFETAVFCQCIVAVSEPEAALIRRAGQDTVKVLGHRLAVNPTPATFEERHGLLFVGSIVDKDSPNLDSLLWFLQNVMPVLAERRPDLARLTIVGYRGGDTDIAALADVDGVEMLGHVDDLGPVYNRHRVFIAPTRFAGGIPYKIHESASRGLPVVASQLLIDELGWTEGQGIVSGGAPDADLFADAVMRLYDDAILWNDVRSAALRQIGRDCDPMRFDRTLVDIVRDVRGDHRSHVH